MIAVGPRHAAISAHRAAYDAFQIAPEGDASEIANCKRLDALDALVEAACGFPILGRSLPEGAGALLAHLQWWLTDESVDAADYQPNYGILLGRSTLRVGKHRKNARLLPMKPKQTDAETNSRFIQSNVDGTFTLKYPGWPEKKYRHINSAIYRRRAIDRGAVRPEHRSQPRAWTSEEMEFVRENWGVIPPKEWPDRLPGRTYEAVRGFARIHKIRAADNPLKRTASACQTGVNNNWTAEELDILRSQPREIAISLLSPNRTEGAIAHMANKIGRHSPSYRRPWSPEEILIVYNNSFDKSLNLLGGERSRQAIINKRNLLGVSDPRGGQWSDQELVLIRNIIRCNDALKDKHRRTGRAIARRIEKVRERQANADAAVAAVKAACANLEMSVRQDIEGELLLAVLAKQIDISQVGEALRATRTRIYGRRHLSLDAPIGDGNMTWIENISSDQDHF